LKVARLLPVINLPENRAKLKKPVMQPEVLSAKSVFTMISNRDLWEEADLISVVKYLKGNKHLHIPPEWRDVLPTHL
jgi:hypothetical protein